MGSRSRGPEIGDLVASRYHVEAVLGRGGMGVVLAVRDEVSGEPLALKLLQPAQDDEPDSTADGEERAARLLREGRATMRLTSPHVVRVRDCGIAEGSPYLVMERLEGSDLADLHPLGERVPWRDVADVVMQVCEALSHAHAAGIIHRDIKPSNLFRCSGASGGVVKVLDFGISKMTSRAEWERTASLTKSEIMIGSPQFVSPEHLRDPKTVDARTDIWSIGVVLFRLLTGRYPFGGSTLGELFVAVLERDAPSLASCDVDAPAEMQRIVNRCLQRNRDDRYSNVGELASDLAPLVSPRWASFAEGIVARVGASTTGGRARVVARSQAPGPDPAEATTDASRRRPWQALAGSVLLGAAIVAAALLVRGSRPEPAAPATALAPLVQANAAPIVTQEPVKDPATEAVAGSAVAAVAPPAPASPASPASASPIARASAPPVRPPAPSSSLDAKPPAPSAAPSPASSDLHANPYAHPSAQ